MRITTETGEKKRTTKSVDYCHVCRRQKKELNKKVEERQKVVAANEEKKRKVKRAEYAKRDARRAETAEEAELIRRILARRSLLRFIQRFHPAYQAGWVHRLICEKLETFVEQVARRESPRLMLFMPPRHGKSMIASQNFPAWALGKHPEFEIIAASYGTSLPLKFSRSVRAFLREPAYQKIFAETRLDSDNENVEGWQTTRGGGYVPAGVGTGVTGKGAHILIVDDPIKDAEEADSAVVRESTWDWYGSTAYTRLAPGGGVLIIQTRWHDADLAGRAISQMKEAVKAADAERSAKLEAGVDPAVVEAAYQQALREIDRWEIVVFPAIAEQDEYLTGDREIVYEPRPGAELLRKQGEALHPDRFDATKLARIKRALQPRHWSALYQQNPVPMEGAFFTKDMIRREPYPPDTREFRLFATWDLAIGQSQSSDYTVGIVGGLDFENNLHVLDMIRGRMNTYQIVEAILDTAQKYQVMCTGIEKGQLEQAIRVHLEQRMRERKQFPTFAEGEHALKPITDKIKRAGPLQGRMQQGMVYFPDQPWTDTVIHELLRFPGGEHDDCVDAMAWLMRLASQYGPPKSRVKETKHKSWKDKLKTVGGKQKSAMGA
jgi:predicted phage terminase large subunit-like protein